MIRRSLVTALMLVYSLASSSARAQTSSSQLGPPAAAAVPRSVPFSGQILTPAGGARTDTVVLTFGLYTDQKDGAPLWTEQQLVTLDATGRYSVILGSVSAEGLPVHAFAASAPKWLGVTVEAEPEQPRVMLLSVPYALKAADADTVGGKPASEFVVRAHLFDTVKSTLKAEGYAPRLSNPATSVPGVLAVFTDASNNISNSNVVQNGTNIGINVSPSYPLHVFGVTGGPFGYQTLRLDNSHIAGSSFTLGPTVAGAHVYSMLSSGPSSALGAGFLAVYDEGVGQFRLVIGPTGNVGIGTTGPNSRLSVAGPDNFNSVVFDVGRVGIPEFWVTAFGQLFLRLDNTSTTKHVCMNGSANGYLVGCSSAAEYVPTVQNARGYPVAGDLVSMAGPNPYDDEHAPFAVAQAATACDSNLIGVLLEPELGADGGKLNEHYLPLAIYGYFPARVTVANGAIKRGDAITSSSKAGFGMKSPGACRIIGYALQDADADGTIQVFVNLGESTAPAVSAMETRITALQIENAALQAANAALEARMAAVERALQQGLGSKKETRADPQP